MYRLDDDMTAEPLAHSPKPPASEQTYKCHVGCVWSDAAANAHAACVYYHGDKATFVKAVEAAALYHDLGKLDEANQAVLRKTSSERLPVPHEDAGVAELLRKNRYEAAILAAAHHAGLFCAEKEQKKANRLFRNLGERTIGGQRTVVADRSDANLEAYLNWHAGTTLPILEGEPKQPVKTCGFTRRISLSCLVDADHGDTARHYGEEVEAERVRGRWNERLAALDSYVQGLPQISTRDALRAKMYAACRAAETSTAIKACDAPVGSGKTTAIMANILQAAIERNLRHIIVVLPYTNIIKQSVETYRKALTLPGENPEDVVAEHHHRADFASIELRQLATLWRAPVVVTTAVQFFETLGSHHPSRLRKLHELPGSAVFVDEMHTALPSPLWPQVWCWLQTWTEEWSGYLVLASGSLPRFWELEEFVGKPMVVPNLLPDELSQQLIEAEGERIRYAVRERPMSPDELVEFVLEKPGPRLVIVNTVQSAAHLADKLRRRGEDVMHLSTALAPEHRNHIVERVEARLQSVYKDWTLVATSCVEAGMNFSFRSGLRERASTASLIQTGGRVSRGAEYEGAVVWDFQAEGGLLTQNPALELPRRAVRQMFESEQMNALPSGDLAKLALQRELTEQGKEDAEALKMAENAMDYPRVGELCRVIKTDTRLIVVSKPIADLIRSRKRVQSQELLRHSVQMWTQKIAKGGLPIELLRGSEGEPDAIYYWLAPYDPDFLGYMAGALPILETVKSGEFIA